MSDAEIIEAIRSEIREAFRQDRELTIKETLERFGLDMSKNDDFISQNKADKIIGRAARTKGKANGTIEFINVTEGRFGRVALNRADVMRIKNKLKFNKR
jgi:hypothetical protein